MMYGGERFGDEAFLRFLLSSELLLIFIYAMEILSVVESKYVADGVRLVYLARCGNSHPNISFNFTLLIKGPAHMESVLGVPETRLHF